MQPLIGNGPSRVLLCVLSAFLGWNAAAADPRGESVLVVYNSSMPESREVAEHYARKRDVPSAQVIGFDLPREEQITRADFAEKLQKPLWREIEKLGLITYSKGGALGRRPAEVAISDAKIRYLVLCYGVPVKVARQEGLKEDGQDKLAPELQQRNEAAVDSELVWLPMLPARIALTGPAPNPLFGATNASLLNPKNGLLMTARLDGPSAEIAKGLVDKAIQAEQEGLCGRAYFDMRGLTNNSYQLGDDWIRGAGDLAGRYGFEVVMDKQPETFRPSFPMSDVALYFGWYEQNMDGPFAAGMADFVPGAIAYHLHSFSATVLRTPHLQWAGPLLARGATATIGFTEEPYLQLTPDLPVLASRLLFLGFSFGEAAWAAQKFLSWQATVIGDPLYTPFAVPPQERYSQRMAAKDPKIEWSHLLVINRNLAMNTPLDEVLNYMDSVQGARESALLQEKMAEIYKRRGMVIEAADAYVEALKLKPRPLQRLRMGVIAGTMLSNLGRNQEAYEILKGLVADFPAYPGRENLYRKLAQVATALDKKEEAAEYHKLASEAGGS